jgi:predicted nucleic acid-binding protein
VLDIILERQPFAEQASLLLQIVQKRNLEIFLTATTITDLYYIARKAKGRDTALNFITDLLQIVEIAGVDKDVIVHALNSNMIDFEDAVQESAAKRESIGVIVTRNEMDFRHSALTVYTPDSFLRSF